MQSKKLNYNIAWSSSDKTFCNIVIILKMIPDWF